MPGDEISVEGSYNTINQIPLFIKIGKHHLISIHRITEISYIEEGVVYVIGDVTYYTEQPSWMKSTEHDVEEKKTPIIVIHYINEESIPDTIRRTGEFATELWKSLTTSTAIV